MVVDFFFYVLKLPAACQSPLPKCEPQSLLRNLLLKDNMQDTQEDIFRLQG